MCLDRGWTGAGFKTVEFETAWKEYTGLPHAHFLASATAGLHLSLHVLKKRGGWHDGDEVITTPLTFVSSNHPILYERLRPVFADVDESLCLDPVSVAARVSERTRAVMFVGIGGNVGGYAQIVDICRSRGIQVILDAAHMTGTRVDGRQVGEEADSAVFSFHAVKNLPTGSAGMVCFRDPEMDRLARQLSWMGIDKNTYERRRGPGYEWHYDVPNVGFNYGGNSIMAAVALVQLRHLDEDNASRRMLATTYDQLFSGSHDVLVVAHSKNCVSSRHLYQVRVKNRNRVLESLNGKGIYPGVHYRDNTEYPMYSYAAGTCPMAANLSSEILSLPLHLGLEAEDCVRVAKALQEAIAASEVHHQDAETRAGKQRVRENS